MGGFDDERRSGGSTTPRDSRWRRLALGALATVWTALALVPGPAVAHPGHEHGFDPGAWLPVGLFLLGVGAVGASTSAGNHESLVGWATDVGVAVGVLFVLASFGLLVLQAAQSM